MIRRPTQTFVLRERVAAHVAASTESDRASMRGTGIFQIPDPSVGQFEVQTVFVTNLTLDEARRRGTECIQATWVPDEMFTLSQILDAKGGHGRSYETLEACPAPDRWFSDAFELE